MNTTRALPSILVAVGALLAGGCGTSETPAASPEAAVAATAAEHQHDAPTPSPAAEVAPATAVLEQELAYGEGRTSNLVGYLAMPQDAALLYPDALDAMVMYYGQVMTDRERLATLNVPILGFFGADDESIPVREVQGFRGTLQELGKNAEVLIVPRVGHAFANPSGGTYNEQAASEAWATTLTFLARHLKLDTPTQQ